jgi:hypothetical protein
MLLLAVFAALCSGQTFLFWGTVSVFSSSDCTGSKIAEVATRQQMGCTNVACSQQLDPVWGPTLPQVEGSSYSFSCLDLNSKYPFPLTLPFNTYVFRNVSACAGKVDILHGLPNGACLNGVSQVCSGSTFTRTTFENQDCSGSVLEVNVTGIECRRTAARDEMRDACGVACFHEDTQILYGYVLIDLGALQAGELHDCAVPHIVRSSGIRIDTDCGGKPLRVTLDHLVLVADKGLIEAQDIRVGDSLFRKDKLCRVVSIAPEVNQRYFGLNCISSLVFADGFHVSTFGKYHTLPALWMSTVGRVLGAKRASLIGEMIVQFFFEQRP